MDMMPILEAIEEFMTAARLFPILGLIGLDLVFGIAAAIKNGEFDFAELGRFYQTMVLPYILAYLGVYIALQYVPEAVGFIGDAVDVLVFGAIVTRLVASVLKNLAKLDLKPAK